VKAYSSMSYAVSTSTLDPGGFGHDAPGGLDAVGAGHPHVHEHHVGAELEGEPHRLGSVGGLADDGDVRLFLQ
jgi:hypothetical protein